MAKFLLALDAGHRMGTPGRRCWKQFDPAEHREWWLNNRIALYLAERAEIYEGFEIIRTDDVTGVTDISTLERCRRANAAKADFFLSIHHNGAINGGSGGGVTAFCYYGSAKGREWRDTLYRAVIAAGKLKGNRANPLQEYGYDVLRHTNMPAVLIEHGFMDSSTDVPIIISEAYAKAVGYAEADCIAMRIGLCRKVVELPTAKADPAATASVWAKEACRWAVEHGIVAGDGNGNYHWQEPVTREQLAVILKKALEK